MSKAVAVDGDTQFETSTAKHSEDIGKTGFWQPDLSKPDVTRGQTISVNGKKVELSAVMTWTYIGGTAANGSPVGPFPDRAELTANSTNSTNPTNPTKLTDANQHVLVEGDEATGDTDSGNKIIVTKSQDLLKTN